MHVLKTYLEGLVPLGKFSVQSYLNNFSPAEQEAIKTQTTTESFQCQLS